MFVKTPNFLANSVLPATPCAINTPSVSKVVPSLNCTPSTLVSPLISCISLVSTFTLSALNSGAFSPLVKIVISFAIFIKSFVSDIAYSPLPNTETLLFL